ncbi:MAG: hypothetical protein K0S71_2483 [Clostridia bacterium]|jgi:predicted glycosyltransferase involved in capsule biosynthesis|nr:hypothetical protein [Clostridia bacterium]
MTFENVSLLVPFQSDEGIRKKNWDWLRKRYETIMPEMEICIGESAGALYSRAQGINSAAKKASRNIYVISDADVIFNRVHIEMAIKMLEIYAWVIPYTHMVKLTQTMSDELLNKEPSSGIEHLDTSNCEVLSYYPMGGICVITRDIFEKSGGFDERFRGWGGEDDAFQRIVDWLYGRHGRLDEVKLWHLYHPKQIVTEEYYKVSRVLLFEKGYASLEQVKETNEYLRRQNGFSH